jgi:oligopeptide/dipeptide ABC transporter ATP-binding protein
VTTALLDIENLVVVFGGSRRFLRQPKPTVRAVDGVSLTIANGEVLGLVGESGCGKSTLARAVLGTQRETSGAIRLQGRIVSGLDARAARAARRDIQYVHQDPGAALDPWWRIGDTLHEALKINGVRPATERDARIESVLDAVGLAPAICRRYPHELSGGQQRRVGLARTLVLKPRLVLLDEPTSGLDLSVQATVLRLIRDLHQQFGLAYLFISHDLAVVRQMCHRVAIMYLGSIVESGPSSEVFRAPRHPYTCALLSASPRLDGTARRVTDVIRGDPPSPASRPSGCAFRTRCTYATARCSERSPAMNAIGEDGHSVACLRTSELPTA